MLILDYDIKIEDTKDNYSIVKINKNGKQIYIGSKYNMRAEIDKFLDKARCSKKDKQNLIFIVYGFGTGEHIKALRKEFINNQILVFEPNIKLYNFIIKEYKWISADKNLHIISCNENELETNFRKYIDEVKMSYMEVLDFSNYFNIYIDEYKAFIKAFKAMIVNLVLNRNTALVSNERWFSTLMNNIKYIVKGIPIDEYQGKYKNKPAVIVSAGPSLEKNIDELKKLDNQMLIICGGRTLRSLKDKDIDPHLLVSVDAYNVQYELAQGYIEKYNGPLLFYEGTNEDIVKNHPGDKIFYTNLKFIKDISEREMGILPQGGSVAHIMTDFAIIAECNPIIFIGQDLAYTNDLSYSRISGNKDGKMTFETEKRDTDIFVDGIDGNPVRTSLAFDRFRRTFEEIIEDNPNTCFINATEGGARIKGTIEMSLKEVINKYAGEKISPVSRTEYSVNIKKNVLNYLKEAKKTSDFIIKECDRSIRLLEELNKYYITKSYSKMNAILEKLDKIDKEIQEEYEKVEIISSRVYPAMYKILTAKTANSEKPGIDDAKMITEQNKKFYIEIREVLKECFENIDDLIKNIENE